MDVVRCELCEEWSKPAPSKRTIAGKCKSFEAGKKNATKKQIDNAYMARGNCPFLGCTRRFCKKFKEIKT